MEVNETDIKPDTVTIQPSRAGRDAGFSDATRRQIAFKSGNICAFPNCGREFIADETEAGDKAASVAQAAHIIAAAPNGPRYDSKYDIGFRSSASNGIYLCLQHSYIIDQQPKQYDAEWLFRKKAEHEKRVRAAVLREISEVTFEELDAVVSSIIATVVDTSAPNFVLPAEIEHKIEHNLLTAESRSMIEAGMTQTSRVASYIEWATSQDANFFKRLTARYQSVYFGGVAEGLVGDALLNHIFATVEQLAHVGGNDRRRAAVLATTVRMFELCKILEVPDAAA